MKHSILIVFLAVLMVLSLGAGSASGVVINVPADFATIQGAINAAVSGDEIIVANGIYNEVINFQGKAINLHSTGDPEFTTINGSSFVNKIVVSCVSGEGAGTILRGFTITGGSNGGMSIHSSSPTIRACVFAGNSGSGMINSCSNSTIINCLFSGNTAINGGGMHNSHSSNLTITNCTFSGNTAIQGGGMYNISSNPSVTNCAFIENLTTSPDPAVSSSDGGGMHNVVSSPVVTYCTFIGNTAIDQGGGMYNIISNPTIINCKFIGNSAVLEGGGMYNHATSNPTVTSCILIANSADIGGGMYNNASSNPIITGCTFVGNSAVLEGGGMYNCNNSSPIVTSSINGGNSPDEIFNCDIGSIPNVSFSNVQGGIGAGSIDGGGNIDLDPLFVDADGLDNIPGTLDDDLRLIPGSLVIESGNSAALPPDTADLDNDGNTTEPIPFDIDGRPRVSGVAVDMGAYEALLVYADPVPGQTVLINPGGGSGVPTDDALVNFTNVSGPIGATVVVTDTVTNLHPDAGGYGAFNAQINVTTSLNDGEFFMTVSIPFAAADLNGAVPLSVDMIYFNQPPGSGNWEQAVSANTVNSPGFGGPVGDRFAVTDTVIPVLSPDLGDYGVFWNPVSLQGFVWANVDHATDFAAGTPLVAAPCPGDITPAGPPVGNGVVNIDDLVALLGAFGPCAAPPAGCVADITPPGGNGVVNIDDLVALLGAFGPCP